MFNCCSKLEHLDLRYLNLNKLKNMKGLSSKCHNILCHHLCVLVLLDIGLMICLRTVLTSISLYVQVLMPIFLGSIFVRINKSILATCKNGLFFYVATSFILSKDLHLMCWYVTLLSSSIRCGY